MKVIKVNFMIYLIRLSILIVLLLLTNGGRVLASASQNEKDFDRLAWKWQYDDAGRVSSMTDPGGKIIDYSYEDIESSGVRFRVSRKYSDDTKVEYEHNRSGLCVKMTDGAGVVRYEYDNLGRLGRVARDGCAAITYLYNSLGQPTSRQIGDFFQINYTYDFLGRLESMDTPVGTIQYEYFTGQGQIVRILPNGIRTYWEYSPNGELQRIVHGFFPQNSNSYLTYAEYKYSYRPDGLIESIQEISSFSKKVVKQYKYDKVGRLVQADASNGHGYHYQYDVFGNRIRAVEDNKKQICTFDWAGRTIGLDGRYCQHDKSGNMIAAKIGKKYLKYRYNQNNQLSAVIGRGVSYRYDGNGQLITRKSYSSDCKFVPNPLSSYWQPLVIEEKKSSQTLVVWDKGSPLLLIRDGKPQFLLHDHLGSVRLITDSKGKISQKVNYDPYGNIITSRETKELFPYFAGLFWDSQAAGYLVSARVYSPDLGRFLQPDPQKRIPYGSQKDLNSYSYCGGDSVNFVDRNGCEPQKAEQVFPFLPNRDIIASYDSVLSLGVGSGVQSVDDIMADAKGRFSAIVIWGSNKGALVDLGRATLLDTAGLARTEIRTVPIEAIDSVSHSAGNCIKIFSQNQIRLDPAGYLLSQSEIYRPGIVSDLTSVDLNNPLKNGLFGVSFTGKSDNLLTSSGEAVGDFLRFFRGLLKLGGGSLTYPITQVGPIASHSLGPMLYDLELEGKIPEINTYDEIDIFRIDDSGNITKSTYHHPISNNISQDDLNKVTTSPSGIYHYKRPNIQSKWELRRIQQNLSKINSKDLANYAMKQIELAQSIVQRRDLSGGTGRVAGPGGYASPGAYAAMDEFHQRSSFSPSSVGGVYLGGAGGTLDGLGMLKGVRLDDNGNLVLVGEDDKDISLPPLRLDDIVTVFRSVYIHGEGPTVTIDPNPEDPENSAMIIRHSKATEDTYVGWVLYQADRLMKGYMLGVDNVTEKDVVSKVPGYGDIVDTMYFGSGNTRKKQKEGIWERFWIIPAESNRFDGPRRELTLFDVPLKVRTQKMKWENGELVDDKKGQSSLGAKAFTSWFTTRYDEIAGEQYLMPPSESGITDPVPVFTELRRIALMTAIAEKLRDQGITMPFWMRDYEVQVMSFERFTPGMEVTRQRKTSRAIHTARIFGGVALSATSKAVKTFATVADVAQAFDDEDIREKLGRSVKLASRLERVVAEAVPSVAIPPLTLHKIEENGHTYQAAPIPGAETRALGPCRLDEVDLTVPIPGGREIKIARSFNSFFNPKDLWGKGWTMNLPRLQKIRIPDSREGEKVYVIGYELITPLNSLYARFQKVRPVPDLGGVKLQVPDDDGPFYGLANDKPNFLKDVETHVLILKDGQRLHFTLPGDLIAIKDGPLLTVYERDNTGQVSRIVAQLGGLTTAKIDLEYSQGRLAKATGVSLETPEAEPVEVTYTYGSSGKLTGVTANEGKLGYKYEGPWVTSTTWTDNIADAQPKTISVFKYNKQGQLTTENVGEHTVQYKTASNPKGVITTATVRKRNFLSNLSIQQKSLGQHSNGKNVNITTSMHYDHQMRPIEAKEANGTLSKWVYKSDGGVEMTVTTPDGHHAKVIDSVDGHQRIFQMNDDPEITIQFDKVGRLTSLAEGGHPVVIQQWRSDGQLARAETDTQDFSFRYGKDAMLSSIFLQPSRSGKSIRKFQETKVNRQGNPTEIEDYTGLHFVLTYDAFGALASAVQKTKKGDLGYDIKRDDKGQVRAVKSSWGDTEFGYTKDGDLNRIDTQRGGRSASVELSDGLVCKFTSFDDSITTFEYYDEGNITGTLRNVNCANGLQLLYNYDDQGRLGNVNVGTSRRERIEYNEKGRVVAYVWEPLDNRGITLKGRRQ